MYYGPLGGALISHLLLLLILGFNNRNILTAIGDDEYECPRSATSTAAFITGILFRFVPTFTIMCTAYASVAAAYESEFLGYLFLVLPIVYVIILGLWWFTGVGERCCRINIEIYPNVLGHNTSLGVRSIMSETDELVSRNIIKQKEKDRTAMINTFSSSLRGSNTKYYNHLPPLNRSIERLLEADREYSMDPHSYCWDGTTEAVELHDRGGQEIRQGVYHSDYHSDYSPNGYDVSSLQIDKTITIPTDMRQGDYTHSYVGNYSNCDGQHRYVYTSKPTESNSRPLSDMPIVHNNTEYINDVSDTYSSAEE